jgi:molecular chaperone HscB
MTDGGGPGPRAIIDGDLVACWSCGRRLAQRAPFCHACGSMQPPRDADPFARLNLERRFDIDTEALERQYRGLRRALDPDRFAARGPRERGYAKAHAEGLDAAYALLRDPVRRARWLLDDAGEAAPGPQEMDAADPDLARELAEIRAGLDAAEDVLEMDVLANRVARDIESAIRRLADAFRRGETARAAALLERVAGLEAAAAEARAKRLAAGGAR